MGDDDRFELSGGPARTLGYAGTDRLDGGAGADRFVVGLGRNLLSSGLASLGDRFVFGSVDDRRPGGQMDVISNCTPSANRTDLRGIDASSSTAGVYEAFGWSDGTAKGHAVWWRPMLLGGLNLHGNADHNVVARSASALRDLSGFATGDVLTSAPERQHAQRDG
ncbi:hypothetical protein [Rubellimicrobium roseum]|uniref:Calcium-binding protein n=1 Tax=Rubellimicrobium roseum TaxID=687525 RepID=A0A5C4NIR0_9RHOB|nr:hypothetical protein [Rubellimicrobium roseum]TNC74714.1 hypothetical protein FHG71_00825 [Rubellimicrobium roseum]